MDTMLGKLVDRRFYLNETCSESNFFFFRPTPVLSEIVRPHSLHAANHPHTQFFFSVPFDVASQFDVLVPGLPVHDDEIHLFHAGHLAFFRHSERVLAEYMKYYRLKDVKTWLRIGEEEKNLEEDQGWPAHRVRDWISEEAGKQNQLRLLEMDVIHQKILEEIEYSTYTFMNPRLTFLRFPGLIYTSFHVSSPSLGVYGVENHSGLDLSTPDSRSETRELIRGILEERKVVSVEARETFHTFSDQGFEYGVELRNANYSGWLWFPLRYAVHYEPDFDKSEKAGFKRWQCQR